ncbi:MAG: prepilin peptidase [Actinobacteria bacterium]|nr:prepilin peptidase [Actinomycetota bacterium]
MKSLIWLLVCQVSGYVVSISIFDYRNEEIRIWRLPSLGHLMLVLVWLFFTFVPWLPPRSQFPSSFKVFIVIELLLFPVLGAIDLDVRKVPDKLLILGSVMCGGVLCFYLGFPGFVKSLLLTIGYAFPLVVVNLIKPGSIGGGDIKLGYVLAAVLTPIGSFFTILEILLIANVLAVFAFPVLRYLTVPPWRGIPMVPFLTSAVLLISFRIL